MMEHFKDIPISIIERLSLAFMLYMLYNKWN